MYLHINWFQWNVQNNNIIGLCFIDVAYKKREKKPGKLDNFNFFSSNQLKAEINVIF